MTLTIIYVFVFVTFKFHFAHANSVQNFNKNGYRIGFSYFETTNRSLVWVLENQN